MSVRTVVERGPKGKRSVAFSLDWPGWNRGAKTPELAVETLESYRERYRPVADLAGMASEFDAAGPLEIVEDRTGTGMTDFYGISFSSSSTELGPMSEVEFERKIRSCGRAGTSSIASRRASRRSCARDRAAADATAT